MRFTIAAASAALIAGAQAQLRNGTANATGAGNNANAIGANGAQATAYDTVVVNAYVTTCPGNVPTTAFAYNGVTYSGTAGQVITVTNCPCTVTAPAGTIPSGATIATAPNGGAAVPTNGNSAAGTGSGAGSAAGNGTAGSGQAPEPYTGSASKLSGAGLAAVFAIAAYAL